MPEIYSSTNATGHQKAVVKNEEKTLSGFWARKSLAAFLAKPKNIRFETQEKEEEIMLFLRRHPITNLGWILSALFLLVLPLFVSPFLLTLGFLPPGTPPGYFVVLPLIWYLGVFGFAFANFLTWYYNVNIVTNERLIDIDWLGLLYRRHSSTQLERIQDVTYKQGGILDSFFDFGSVFIQTAGTEPNFEFEHIPKPNEVASQINKILEAKQIKKP